MKDSGQDIELDIARGVWVARGCLDRRIAAEEEEMVVVVVVVVIVTGWTLNNKFSKNNGAKFWIWRGLITWWPLCSLEWMRPL